MTTPTALGEREALKPCPFCGSKPRSQWFDATSEDDDCGYWGIDCCQAFAHEATKADAIAAWNTRPAAPPLAERDALADRLQALAAKATPDDWTPRNVFTSSFTARVSVLLINDDARLAEALFGNLPTILAALRSRGFAAGVEEAAAWHEGEAIKANDATKKWRRASEPWMIAEACRQEHERSAAAIRALAAPGGLREGGN